MPDPDQLYQNAINAVQGVKTPDTEQMKITLERMVQQGVITPEQLQVALQDRNSFDNIASSPEFAQAQQSALTQLQQIGEEGGLTALDRSRIQDVTDQQTITNRGQEQAILANARERGVGGSGLEMAARLQAQQSAADTASRQGTDVAALAEQRALDAIQGAGQLGGQMQEAEFNRGATKAGAQNAIDAANAAMMNQGNMYNTQTANTAQATNLGEKQRISEGNVGLANEQEQSNKSLPQQAFENEMAKQAAIAGTYNSWANAAAAKRAQKTGFQNQLTAGALQAGGKAAGSMIGGPAAAAAPSFSPSNPTEERFAREYNCGGMVKDYTEGGQVSGKAKVAGDSPENDTVDARLSPGEVVIPRSLVSEFTKHSGSKKGKQKVDHEDVAMIFKALASMKGDK